MAKSLNYSDYKSAGIYFLEEDNSIIESVDVEALRLAVGFSKTGPFNVPVFLNGTADAEKYFGAIDTKLERKGSFFHRSLNTLLKQAPVFALNLLSVDETDKSDMAQLSLQTNKGNVVDGSGKVAQPKEYRQYFDRSKFWYPKAEKVLAQTLPVGGSVSNTNIFNVANTGTKDYTVFVRKAENLKGYNVTVKDFYGSEDKIPYPWMVPSDYMADYFIQVIVVEGNWGKGIYDKLAKDVKWKTFFSEKGLKKDMLSKFLAEEAITVLGNWTGTIIPDFYAKNGQYESIVPIINQVAPQTGFVASLNEELMEELEPDLSDDWTIDLVGHNMGDTFEGFLSYPATDASVKTDIEVADVSANTFSVEVAAGESYTDVTIGDLVKGEDGKLTRVVKKAYSVVDASGVYTFTCSNNVANVGGGDASVHYEWQPYEGVPEGSVPEVPELPEPSVEWKDQIVNVNNIGVNEYYICVEVETPAGAAAVEVHKSIVDLYDSLEGIFLEGLHIGKKNLPGWDTTGELADVEAGIEKIYKVLTDTGIERGLTNMDTIRFRYVIDTMGGGKAAGLGGKKYLSMLAQKAGACTAILSYPSMGTLAESVQPIFRDIDAPYGDFDTKYIPTGGNPDAIGAGAVSIPGEDEGSKYCGVFAPYLKYADGIKTILVPPAADVANAYQRKFTATGNSYATVANMDGILTNSSIAGVEYMFDRNDRDNIEPYGINPIIYRNGQVVIYGDKTAYQDVISDYNYLHTRELLNTIEIEVQRILHPYVFKYNNAETRAEIVRKVTPILQAMQDSGALYSFEIQMDENNNTPEVIERSFGILDIGVKMGKNLEKIVTRIKVNRLSA